MLYPACAFPSPFGWVSLLASASTEHGEAAAQAGRAVLPMVLIGGVLVATFVVIAFDLLNKTVAALGGAVLAVALAMWLGVYPGEDPYRAVYGFLEHDLSVLGVIIGTSILVEIASASGLFHFLAIRMVKLTGGDPRWLLPVVILATLGFVAFLTIAPGTLIMASLVIVITRALDDDPRPYIVGVALAANSGALVTFASGLVTLMIGTSAGIPYVHFLIVSLPLGLLTCLVAFFVIRRSYRRELAPHGDPALRARLVHGFDEWALVKDRRIFYRAALILALTIAGFASAQSLGVGLDYVAIAGGTAALLFSGFDPEAAIKKVKWSVIMFFVGLFVIVGTVQATGLLDVLAEQMMAFSGESTALAMTLLVLLSFALAAVVDNIPTAATLIPIVQTMVARGAWAEPLWWGLIAACNLGGNPTPIGSIAAVIALHALESERGIVIGWGEYLKVGGVVTLLQLGMTLGYIYLFMHLDGFPALGAAAGAG